MSHKFTDETIALGPTALRAEFINECLKRDRKKQKQGLAIF